VFLTKEVTELYKPKSRRRGARGRGRGGSGTSLSSPLSVVSFRSGVWAGIRFGGS